MRTNPYLKFGVQVIITVLAGVIPYLQDQQLDSVEIINLIIIGLGAISVLGAGNLPAGIWSYTKLYVSAATAVATLLVTLIVGGLDAGEIIQLILAGAGALGVAVVPGPRVAPTSSAVAA